jgi:hypothetical protein
MMAFAPGYSPCPSSSPLKILLVFAGYFFGYRFTFPHIWSGFVRCINSLHNLAFWLLYATYNFLLLSRKRFRRTLILIVWFATF